MDTFGLLIKGLKIKHKSSLIVVMTPILDLLLKLLIAFAVTRLIDFPVFQIFLLNFAIMLNLQFLLHYRPYEDKWEEASQLFNSFTYLALNY